MGFTLEAWLRLLRRGGWRVDPSRWGHAALATHAASLISPMHRIGLALHGRALAGIHPPTPLFIIGHWRSGTTLLHTLMSRDPQFAFPSNGDCFAPGTLLFGSGYMRFWMRLLMPRTRPMDGMSIGLNEPQEDEFALAALGAPSPYLRFAFPRRQELCAAALDLDDLPPAQREEWQTTFLLLLRILTRRDPRPLLLKSPTHTCRIPALQELFPEARFIHIQRDPRAVIPSTIKTVRQMFDLNRLQRFGPAEDDALVESVFRDYRHVCARYAATRGLIPPGRLVELRYEHFVQAPLQELERVYQALGLPGFEEARPLFERHLAQVQMHQPAQWEKKSSLQDRITRECGDLLVSLGYA
jgi:hypothetical protein